MKNIKAHFKFAKAERSGILFLLLLICMLQLSYFYINIPKEASYFDDQELAMFQKRVDSLRSIALEKQKPKIFPFNPNFISDYKGFTLGMSTEEIDRLHEFRALNKYVNTVKEFQQVTKVSDSLLEIISPYFKFPDWVTKKKKTKKQYKTFSNTKKKVVEVAVKMDLNTATAEQLKTVYGIGEKLSVRIVKYRNKLGGFVLEKQLQDVYGLKSEVIQNVWKKFSIQSKPKIQKVNINTCTQEELHKIPYISYNLADEIINQRILREGFKTFEDLTKIQNFPSDKIDIIQLYLRFN